MPVLFPALRDALQPGPLRDDCMKPAGERLKEQVLEGTALVSLAAAAATGLSAGISDFTAGAGDSPASPLSAECLNAKLPSPAPVHGVLSDGRTFKVVLDPTARGHGDTSALCAVEAGADADLQARLKWLASPAAQNATDAARTAAQDAAQVDRVQLAAADLSLLSMGLEDRAKTPDALHASSDAATAKLATDMKGSNTATLAQDYLALTQDASLRTLAADQRSDGHLASDRAVLLQGAPNAGSAYDVGGAQDPVLQATSALKGSSLSAQASALRQTSSAERAALPTALGELSRRAESTWSEDHAGALPSSEDQAAMQEGLLAGKPWAAIAQPLEAKYRSQPGILDKHRAEIRRDDVLPAYRQNLPGHAPSPALVSEAEKLWAQGASTPDIVAALGKAMHDLPEWRESFVQKNIGLYYPQPDGWSCGPSSATITMGLEGITKPSYALRQEFVKRLHASPSIGVPWSGVPGVEYIGRTVEQLAKDRYGVALKGYMGDGTNLNAIRQALRDGYVVIVNGDVVPRGVSGHFLVVKAITADGRFEMADPWQPEFANRTIDASQLSQFTHGRDTSHFYAIARA